MCKIYRKYIPVSILLLTISFLGCREEIKPVHIHELDVTPKIKKKEITGFRFGYIKQIIQKDGKYFASVVFLDSQMKNKKDEFKASTSFASFPDSLDVIELPDQYLICAKRQSQETFLIDTPAKIVVQTLSYDASGNYLFNEKIDKKRLLKIYESKEISRFSKIPFLFHIFHNNIQSIEEKYIP